MIPSIVETLVGACDELSLLLRTLEITRTQNFISVKSVSTPSEAQAAQRVAAHKRAGLLAAGRSLRRSLELNKELLAAEDEKRRDRAQEEREKEDTMPQLSQQAHLHLLYQALKQDERILLTCTDGDFAMLLDGEHTLHFSVAPPTKHSLATLAAQAAMLLYGEESIALCTAALTLVTLIFCEIAPKSIAVQNAAAVARVVIRPIAAMSTLVYPIGRLCTNLVNAVFAVFNIKIAAEPFVSEEELKLVLSGAAKSGQVDSGEKEMIQNVLDMSETPVREVMTPLVRVVGVEQSTSLVELQKIWRTHRFSRVPVYADRVDNIVGVVYSMRLLEYELKQELLSTIKVENLTQKPPYYVPESMSVVKLMRELLARKTHMAIVVNEHGGVVGIATFEDCVEEIVGEIYDENDRPDESEINDDYIRQVAHDVYDVDCRAFVDDLAESIGIDIPSSALYDTVGGFTCDCFDRIPNVGETMVVHMASASKNYDDDSQDEDEPSNFGSRGRSFSDTPGDEGEKADFCAVRPVRITVLDGGMKILRKVQIRVNDAARLKEVIDGQTGAPSRMLGAGGGDDSRIDENREPSVDEVTVDDRTETWQPSR